MLRRTWPSLILVALSACAGSGISPEPPTAPKTAAPITASATDIGDRVDALLEAEWKASGVSPAGPASDAQFFRRAYLDLAGTLPPPEAVTAFLADTSPDKRARAVDALLASPRYAERWAAYWEEVLLRDSAKENIVDRAALRAWLRARFAENAPWDRVARDLVTATGKSSPGGSARERRMAAAIDAAGAEDAGVNGAVNWLLQFKRSTEDLAGATSRTFLGVQIQCAQCHDHKTEKWTTTDFRRFAAAFARTRVRAAVYLRALSRRPSAEEIARWVRFLDEAAAAPEDSPTPAGGQGPLARLRKRAPSVAMTPRDRAYEDLFRALLGSSEFAFQH
jgi:hypothetical protein